MLERLSTEQSSTRDCIARAKALAPLIAAHAARTEQEREIASEVLAALHEARLFRMLIPKSCGGWEADPATFMQAIEELAKADASTAWCVAQASGCSMAAAYVSPAVARTIFGAADAVMAWGPVGPNAKAVVVAGGYRASGAWSFASGLKHAAWLGCHCPVLEPDGSPRLAPDGKPAERTMLIPKTSVRINDIWRVIVKTFAFVLCAATAALVGAVFVSVDAAAVQMLLTVFTTTAGILAGFVSGRASTSRAR